MRSKDCNLPPRTLARVRDSPGQVRKHWRGDELLDDGHGFGLGALLAVSPFDLVSALVSFVYSLALAHILMDEPVQLRTKAQCKEWS